MEERSNSDVSGKGREGFWDTTREKSWEARGMEERSRRNGMSRTSTSTSNGSDPADFFWVANNLS